MFKVKLERKLPDGIVLPAGSKAIPLGHEKYSIVDAEDYDFLMQWDWRYARGYAIRDKKIRNPNGKSIVKRTFMHRVILNTPEGMDTDHINGDRADNRKTNLRFCTRRENTLNRRPLSGSSQYKGVFLIKRYKYKKWMAYIKACGKGRFLGCFALEKDAALAYNAAAKELFGEFAFLNDATPAKQEGINL